MPVRSRGVALRIASVLCALLVAAAAGGGTLNVHPAPNLPAPNAPAPAAEAPVESPAAPAITEPAIAGRTEAEWRDGALARQRDATAASDALAACEAREAPAPYSDYEAYVKPIARRPGYQWVTIKRCDDERRALESAQAALADFEESARRAAVPPGWLR